MSNRSPKSPKLKNKPKKAGKKKSKISIRAIIWTALIGASTILGGIGSAVYFLPRVRATVSDPIDPDDPFSSSVTITNVGSIPLWSVVPSIGVHNVTNKDGGEVLGKEEDATKPTYPAVSVRGMDARHPRDLVPGAEFTFAINDNIGTPPGKLESADI